MADARARVGTCASTDRGARTGTRASANARARTRARARTGTRVTARTRTCATSRTRTRKCAREKCLRRAGGSCGAVNGAPGAAAARSRGATASVGRLDAGVRARRRGALPRAPGRARRGRVPCCRDAGRACRRRATLLGVARAHTPCRLARPRRDAHGRRVRIARIRQHGRDREGVHRPIEVASCHALSPRVAPGHVTCSLSLSPPCSLPFARARGGLSSLAASHSAHAEVT